jgi:hypothetical protein
VFLEEAEFQFFHPTQYDLHGSIYFVSDFDCYYQSLSCLMMPFDCRFNFFPGAFSSQSSVRFES